MIPVTVEYTDTAEFAFDGLNAMAAVDQNRSNWQQALSSIVGAVGIVQQFALNSRMVDLAERGVDLAEQQYALTERNYNEIALGGFNRSSAYYDDCIADMKKYIRTMLECGLGDDQLATPAVDYDAERGRAEMQVTATFSRTRANIKARYGKYRTGAICNQNLRLDLMEGLARVDAADKAYRYAEARTERLEDRSYQRKLQAAQIAYNISSLSMNGLFQGVSGASQGIGQTANGVRGVLAAQGAQSEAFQNLGNFWGTIANGALNFAGYNSGGSPFAGVSNPFSSAPAQSATNSLLGGAGGVGNIGGVISYGAGQTAGAGLVGAGHGAGQQQPTTPPV